MECLRKRSGGCQYSQRSVAVFLESCRSDNFNTRFHGHTPLCRAEPRGITALFSGWTFALYSKTRVLVTTRDVLEKSKPGWKTKNASVGLNHKSEESKIDFTGTGDFHLPIGSVYIYFEPLLPCIATTR